MECYKKLRIELTKLPLLLEKVFKTLKIKKQSNK